MIIQVIIRLTLYMDQAIIRNRHKMANESHPGIENTVGHILYSIATHVELRESHWFPPCRNFLCIFGVGINRIHVVPRGK